MASVKNKNKTESLIQSEILKALKSKGHVAVKYPVGPFGTTGVSDLLCCVYIRKVRCPVCSGNLFNQSVAGGYFCVKCQPLENEKIKISTQGQKAAPIEAFPCGICASIQYRGIARGWLCAGCGQVIEDDVLRLFCKPKILRRGYMP